MPNNERLIAAIISVDDSEAIKEDLGTIDYLEKEFRWLDDSKIFLDRCMLAEEDSTDEWERYINYLVNWAFDHYGEEFKGCSPACFNEWRSNDDE